jgi:hypothetical protein
MVLITCCNELGQRERGMEGYIGLVKSETNTRKQEGDIPHGSEREVCGRMRDRILPHTLPQACIL